MLSALLNTRITSSTNGAFLAMQQLVGLVTSATLKIDQVTYVSCQNFRRENLRGDYHGYVCKDTVDVLPRTFVN